MEIGGNSSSKHSGGRRWTDALLTREKGRAQGGEGRVQGREEVCLGRTGANLTPDNRGGALEPGAGTTLVQAEGRPCWWPLDRAMTGR